MHLAGIQDSVKEFLSENATTILTAGGVVGTVTTAVLAGRAGFKAAEIIEAERVMQHSEAGDLDADLPELDTLTKVKLVGLQFAPPVLTGGATIVAIIFSHKMSAQKAAALAAAYGLSERQLREYKDKVQQQLTGPKAQKIDDELAQDRVNNTPGAGQIIVVEGEVLCFDAPSGRYFKSTMEGIKAAVNRTNERILHNDSVGASYFYDLLGLQPTSWSESVYWNLDNMLEVTYSTVFSDDKRPCIAIDFKVMPTVDNNRRSY